MGEDGRTFQAEVIGDLLNGRRHAGPFLKIFDETDDFLLSFGQTLHRRGSGFAIG
ncbi:hypothetical protein SDC9_151034 [bioreactor metagenome]|uniref:Uncharacterized protein n=1 Tax=bioreactor metagenome TaxID=1076179 RepID=A0A645ER32_9ZZZZ